MNTVNEIKKLKKEKNAIVLAHCYQNVEIDEVADFVGDSLYLSKVASETNAKIIVFAGVYFMAQSAKLLSPDKRVFIPTVNANCMMANMINVNNLKSFKSKYPGIPVVCYINSTAEVKAECDICCTSSNAVEVVKSLNSEKVLFVPDNYLGKWIQKSIKDTEIITFNGYCPIHLRIRPEDIINIRKEYPNALVLAHPECHYLVSELADFVGSTKKIMDFVENSKNKQFIIATEKGVVDRLNRDSLKNNWGKEFILINENIICPDMKTNTCDDIYNVLLNENNEVFIDENVASRAKLCIEKMLKVKI